MKIAVVRLYSDFKKKYENIDNFVIHQNGDLVLQRKINNWEHQKDTINNIEAIVAIAKGNWKSIELIEKN